MPRPGKPRSQECVCRAFLCALSLVPLSPSECVSGGRLHLVSQLPERISCPLLPLGLKDYSCLFSPLSHSTPVVG